MSQNNQKPDGVDVKTTITDEVKHLTPEDIEAIAEIAPVGNDHIHETEDEIPENVVPLHKHGPDCVHVSAEEPLPEEAKAFFEHIKAIGGTVTPVDEPNDFEPVEGACWPDELAKLKKYQDTNITKIPDTPKIPDTTNIAEPTKPNVMHAERFWEFFGYKKGDIRQKDLETLRVEDIKYLYCLENGVMFAAMEPNKHERSQVDKSRGYVPFGYPLQLQQVGAQHSAKLVFMPTLGHETQSIEVNEKTGITMRWRLSSQQIIAYLHGWLWAYGLTDEASERIQQEAREKAALEADKKIAEAVAKQAKMLAAEKSDTNPDLQVPPDFQPEYEAPESPSALDCLEESFQKAELPNDNQELALGAE